MVILVLRWDIDCTLYDAVPVHLIYNYCFERDLVPRTLFSKLIGGAFSL